MVPSSIHLSIPHDSWLLVFGVEDLVLPLSPVLLGGIVLVSLLMTIAVLTLGRSIQRYRQFNRRESIRGDLRDELLGRLYGSDEPDWDQWITAFTPLERSVVESLLDEYLRELDGRDAAKLVELGIALGIPERARDDIETGDLYEGLHGLTWLALLQSPPELSFLETHCTGTPRERAAAARVLYVCDHPDIESVGVDLLLREADGAYSVFGIDTLYRVTQTDPSHLFDRAATEYTTWEPALQQQVLLVTHQLQTVVGSADLSWVVDLFSSSDERTRIEAVKALSGYGWRDSLRDQMDLDAICSDESPKVRASAYHLLSTWGDEEAIATLQSAAAQETNTRAQVAAAEALIRHRERHSVTIPESLEVAWKWAEANATFDSVAKDISHSRQNNA